MRSTVVAFVTALVCLFAGTAHAAWNPDWKQRARIGLNTATEGAATTAPADNVPVLVRLHTGNFSFVDAKPDGSDLRFVAADDKTPLKFHIEKFDGLNELALVWVQVPKLAAGNKDEHVWLYYGNANAAPGGEARATYDASQALVYHFSEREGAPQDSTANANHAARSSAKLGGAGLIGGSLVFEGAQELVLPVTPSLQAGANGYTVSMWVKPTETMDASLYAQADAPQGLRLSLRGGKFVAESGALAASSSAPVAVGAWQHVAVVVKEGLVLYVNGVESARASGAPAQLGGAGVVGKDFKGEIDELQVSATVRPADWIKLAALSQGPDQKLVSYGAAEGGASEEEGASYIKILLGAVTLDGWIVIGILAVMFIVSVYVMVAKTLMGGDQFTFGILLGAFGMGSVAGALFAVRLRAKASNEIAYVTSNLFYAGATFGAATITDLWIALPFIAVGGIGWVVANSTINIVVQFASAAHVVGRSISLYHMLTFGGMAIGSYCWGLLADHIGLAEALTVSGVLLVAGTLLGFVAPLSKED